MICAASFKENGAVSNGVMAMEPLVGSGQEQMIMYPVLDFYPRKTGEEVRVDGMFARLLEVAAQTRSEQEKTQMPSELPIDIIFVMDTTNSMKPYLKMALEAVKEFAKASDDGVRFGFIGYQDKISKGFDYEAKTFSNATQPADEFVRTLSGVFAREKGVKGDDIPESVFEGIDTALESSLWRENAVKLIFLVGDAPGREDNLNIKSLRDKAYTRKIDVFAFHIKNSTISAEL